MRRKGIGFFILVIIFCLAIGTFVLNMNARLQKVCTEETTAILDHYSEEYSTDSDGGSSLVYYPVYQYRANGKIVEAKSNTGSGNKKYAEGTEVTLMYNPDNYYEFYVEGDNTMKIIGWAAYGLAIFIFIMMVLSVLGIVNVRTARGVATGGAVVSAVGLISALKNRNNGQ